MNDDYIEIGKILSEKISKKKDIEKFVKKVHLNDFIRELSVIISKADNDTHYLYPELSIKYRLSNEVIDEAKIKNNIEISLRAVAEYTNINFDNLIDFLNNTYNYPLYCKNNINKDRGDKTYFFNAIKQFKI